MHLVDVRARYLAHRLHVVGRVGAGGHRLEPAHVVAQHAAVFGVGVGLELFGELLNLRPRALGEPPEHLAVRHYERDLAAHLRDHRAERDALGERRVLNRLSRELDREEIHAARAEVADYLRQQVSHADALREPARHLYLHRLGDAEPVYPRDVGGRDVGVADAGREGPDRAEQVHVAVGAEHDVAGLYHSGLEHDVLPDAVIYVEEARYALTLTELADYLLIGRDLL